MFPIFVYILNLTQTFKQKLRIYNLWKNYLKLLPDFAYWVASCCEHHLISRKIINTFRVFATAYSSFASRRFRYLEIIETIADFSLQNKVWVFNGSMVFSSSYIQLYMQQHVSWLGATLIIELVSARSLQLCNSFQIKTP